MPICGRTDLASEALSLHSRASGRLGALSGVRAAQELVYDCPVTAVEILDAQGEAALQKPQGLYYTLDLPRSHDHGALERSVRALAELLRRCLPAGGSGTVLIAALGNPNITPDAVGPLTAEHVLVTRHLKEQEPGLFSAFRPTVLCRPNVLASSGLESAEQLRSLCALLRPDLVLAVDALAGTELQALCHCIQICNTGISPGSGVGNNRKALTKESLGIPVVALGVPTVIDAGALSQEEELAAMFVTPRDIDAAVRQVSRVLGYGINLALHPGLSMEEMDDLLL